MGYPGIKQQVIRTGGEIYPREQPSERFVTWNILTDLSMNVGFYFPKIILGNIIKKFLLNPQWDL